MTWLVHESRGFALGYCAMWACLAVGCGAGLVLVFYNGVWEGVLGFPVAAGVAVALRWEWATRIRYRQESRRAGWVIDVAAHGGAGLDGSEGRNPPQS